MLSDLRKDLRETGNPQQVEILSKFFKTGKGQYGEGDIFLGIKVPVQRAIVKNYLNLELTDIQELLNSRFHEERLSGLIILTKQFKKYKKDKLKQRQIFEFYLKNTSRINNWDLVDLSAPQIVGEFLLRENNGILTDLAKSNNIWERRIAMISSFAFIKNRRFGEALSIADRLVNDDQDLIHKAVGWMLREIGKRNRNVLEIFLQERYKKMPRTMLRYAIEKFPEEIRQKYLKGDVF